VQLDICQSLIIAERRSLHKSDGARRALAACGDDSTAGPTTSTTGAERARMTITVSDTAMDAPDHVAGGLVDVTLHAEAGDLPHHVVFLRLVDGVTYDQLLAAPEGEDASMFTFQGGHGTLLPEHTAHLTLDLPAGDYAVRDLGEQNLSSAELTVDGEQGRQEPDAQGTVALGSGMAIHLPNGFTLDGTWKFTNNDTTEPHEAVLIKLQPGKTADDLISWASSFDGPPPGDFVGGFGAIGPGLSGWLDFDEPVDDSTYVLACFLPGPDGTLHVAHGMVATVPAP
jgi:hypothetical protein